MAPHSDNRLNHRPHHPHVPGRGADISSELRYLVRSAEPAVVFSSLAHLCVPSFSDACTIDIIEYGEIAYRIDYARSDAADADVTPTEDFDRALCTPFAWAGTGPDDTGYAGVMTHRWRTRQPDSTDVTRAAILARHGVATVTEERRFGHTHRGEYRVEQRRAVLEAGRPDGGPVDVADTELRPPTFGSRSRRGTVQPWRCRTAN